MTKTKYSAKINLELHTLTLAHSQKWIQFCSCNTHTHTSFGFIHLLKNAHSHRHTHRSHPHTFITALSRMWKLLISDNTLLYTEIATAIFIKDTERKERTKFAEHIHYAYYRNDDYYKYHIT